MALVQLEVAARITISKLRYGPASYSWQFPFRGQWVKGHAGIRKSDDEFTSPESLNEKPLTGLQHWRVAGNLLTSSHFPVLEASTKNR
jgi:hypothetical protein